MLWALLRLSVRDAGPQLRYRRFHLVCRVRGTLRAVLPRSSRSGLTRSDGAGTGSRARPESECDLPPCLRSHPGLYPALISRNMRHRKHLRRAGRPGSRENAGARRRPGNADGPGNDADGPGVTPGRLGEVTSDNQKSMSPPPPGAAGALSFSGFSAITASVVRNSPAIEAAFCSATWSPWRGR